MEVEAPVRKFAMRPSAALGAFVERVWGWEGSADMTLPVLLPGTGVDFFVHYAAPFLVEVAGVAARLPKAHLTCVRSGAYRLAPSGTVGFVAVRFRSGALRHFGGVEGRMAPFPDARELWGADVEVLPDKLAALPDFGARGRCVAAFVESRLGIGKAALCRADRMMAALYYGASSARMPELAGRLGLGQRQFEREVRRACGLSPKNYSRICRLHHTVRGILLSSGRDHLGEILANGYYDQAHFVHEFRALTGLRPCDYFAPGASMSHFYNTNMAALMHNAAKGHT